MPQNPIAIRNIGSNGILMDGVVDEYLVPAGAVSYAVNVHFDKIGAVTVRKGMTAIGSQIASSHNISGLFQFLDTGTGTNSQLVAVCNTALYYNASGTWTSKRSGLTADRKARFTNFVDLLFMVNGVDAMATWDGNASNSFSTSTQVTSAPATYYIDNFRSRVWAAKTDSNPSRLYYSGIADASYNISWTSDDSGYIDIAPLDGEDITGIKKWQTALYVFKKSSVYKVFSINETQPDPVISIGTHSQESISVAKDGMYWHNPSGIYQMQGGSPQEISRPVYDIIQAIPASYYDDVSSWIDDDHVYFSIGDVSVNGTSINNCVLRWTISTKIWTVYSYASEIVIGASYNNGTNIVQVVGDNNGYVHTLNSGTTDNGTAINYEMETRWYSISGLRAEKKTIRTIAAISENAEGMNIGWRNGIMKKNEIQPFGQISSQETIFKNNSARGNRFRFSIRGASIKSPISFSGFEILNWINDGIV